MEGRHFENTVYDIKGDHLKTFVAPSKHLWLALCSPLPVSLATFRLEYEGEYESDLEVLSTRTSKFFVLQTYGACSVQKSCSCIRPRTPIGHFEKYHNTFCLFPQILHKHCFQFLLGLTMVPRKNKNNAYAKFGGTNKEYYGIFRSGL